jgi:hypothetical protein
MTNTYKKTKSRIARAILAHGTATDFNAGYYDYAADRTPAKATAEYLRGWNTAAADSKAVRA